MPKIISNSKDVEKCMKFFTFHPLLNRFRDAEKQQTILRNALSDEGTMVLAIENNTIVGYTIILPPEVEERWSKLEFVYALGVVEVAPAYRGKGLAKKLVQEVTSQESYEQKIIISLEYYWHWDLAMTDGDVYKYKRMLKSMLEAGRFEDIHTDDSDIAGYQYNFMMARIGKRISSDQFVQFLKLADPKAFL